MKKLELNRDNAKHYSGDFIQGWQLGVKQQYETDKEAAIEMIEDVLKELITRIRE